MWFWHICRADRTAKMRIMRTRFIPTGLKNTPPRYAISKRNMWMIDRSDIVITYTRGNAGGAAKFKETAQKKRQADNKSV